MSRQFVKLLNTAELKNPQMILRETNDDIYIHLKAQLHNENVSLTTSATRVLVKDFHINLRKLFAMEDDHRSEFLERIFRKYNTEYTMVYEKKRSWIKVVTLRKGRRTYVR